MLPLRATGLLNRQPAAGARRIEAPLRRSRLTQLNWQGLNFWGAEPLLDFQVGRVLDTADTVGDHQAAYLLRVEQGVVQASNPTRRCRDQMGASQAQVCHQAVEVITHIAG